MRWWAIVSWRRPLLQRVGCGISVLAMGGKWRRGIDGVEGEAVMEEVGTWWRTLGPGELLVGGL